MKYTVLIILIFIAAINSSQAQKKNEYPADSVSEASRKAFSKNFTQGKILYNLTCAKCHTVKDGRKEIIPDFSLPQLLDYEMRFYYPEHQDRLTDAKLADEELNQIIVFLRYKERTGRPIHP